MYDRPVSCYTFSGHKFGDVKLHNISEDYHFSNGACVGVAG
jgi:hypothetical protein